MRLLLDTHAFIWYVWAAPDLSSTARRLIDEPNNEKLVSVASLWEMAVKVSTGKLTPKRPFHEIKPVLIDGNGFLLLHVEFAHTVIVSAMPFHHRDPFDRLLVAQSLHENIPIVSADSQLDAYGVTRLW